MTMILMELNYIHSTGYLRDGSSQRCIFDRWICQVHGIALLHLKGRVFLIVSYEANTVRNVSGFLNKKFGDSGLSQTILLHYYIRRQELQ